MIPLTVSAGEGRCRVRARAVRCGRDLSVQILGGTRPHIGAVALAVYEPKRRSATVSSLAVYAHRDDACAIPCAKALSSALGCTVCVAAGLHIDNARPEELRELQKNAEACCLQLAAMLREPAPQAGDGL